MFFINSFKKFIYQIINQLGTNKNRFCIEGSNIERENSKKLFSTLFLVHRMSGTLDNVHLRT